MKREIKQLLAVLLFTLLTSYVIATYLKDYFHTQRPCEGLVGCPESFSFPSRHALVSFALATVIVFNTKRRDVQLIMILLAAIIGLYRVFIGYHLLIDVIVGAALGVVVGYSVNIAFKKLFKLK